MSSLQPPLPNSYWVEPDRILAGEHPAGGSKEATLDRLRRLLAAGINCFIDLTEPGELDSYEKFLPGPAARDPVTYLRKPIRDHGLPESAEQMQEILDALSAGLAEGGRIYLHCRAGIGRTNLVAGCWFASSGEGGDAALARLNARWRSSARSRSWPTVPETEAQNDYVRDWRPMRPMQTPQPAMAAAASDRRDRFRGLLIGLAAGDALGHAAHGLPAGAWADKTAMALCLAESLVARQGHDAADQVESYCAWQHTGRWSSTGACIGISAATSRALATARWTGKPCAGSHDPAHADPEPLARIGPAVAWHLADPRAAIDAAIRCARVTHQAPQTLDAVRYFAALLAGALAGADKSELLTPMYSPLPGYWGTALLQTRVMEVAGGSWRGRMPRSIVSGRNAAAAALEAALWAFESGHDLSQCLEAAASRGSDPNTVAAMVGQLAGAHYGASGLPSAWRGSLARGAEIEALADALHDAVAGQAGG
ncbi:MAG TPA: ADP-ribosylglycohydrolase family protein [Steroidobacteraceae bacterium]